MRTGVARNGVGLALALLVAAPVLVGIAYAALAAVGAVGIEAGPPSVARLARVASERATWAGAGWSVYIAAMATLLAAAGAIAIAVLFRGSGPVDRAARLLAVMPLPVPHLVAGATALLLLGQSGVIARVLAATGVLSTPAEMPPLVYDGAGVALILSLAWKELAFLALLATSVLATRGSALDEVARGLGASPLQAFRHATWPVLWRGLLPGATAVFAFAVGSYEAAALLAPSDPLALPLLIEERYTDPALGRRADAYVLVLVAIALSALLVTLHEWLRARADSGAS